MTEVLEQTTQIQSPQEQMVEATPSTSQIMADALWNMGTTPYQNVEGGAQPITEQAVQQPAEPVQVKEEEAEVLGLDDYFQREYGMNANDFRSKWNEYNTPKEPTQPQEQKWSYDDSKEDDIYNYIHQKKELNRLEKLEVADDAQAAEILRASLQFKYKGVLEAHEIDRMFSKQYSLPAKPVQSLDQDDSEYAANVQAWESQVKERKMDMIIEAKMAKPDLLKYKEQIVQPEITKPPVQQQGPTQEELQAAEAGRKAFLSAVDSNYQNFKGFTITAKDGEVQLPISYNVTPEEQIASKDLVSNINVDEFFAKRWFDENNNPKVNMIQEDLYLLTNREKIHQKIATEAFTQMKAHLIKTQNNINLKGVNPTLGPTQPSQQTPKNESQVLAEKIWSM